MAAAAGSGPAEEAGSFWEDRKPGLYWKESLTARRTVNKTLSSKAVRCVDTLGEPSGETRPGPLLRRAGVLENRQDLPGPPRTSPRALPQAAASRSPRAAGGPVPAWNSPPRLLRSQRGQPHSQVSSVFLLLLLKSTVQHGRRVAFVPTFTYETKPPGHRLCKRSVPPREKAGHLRGAALRCRGVQGGSVPSPHAGCQ